MTITGSEARLETSESGPRKPGAVKLDRVVFYGAPFLKTIVTGPGGKPSKLRTRQRRWVGKSLPVSASA